MKKLLYLLLAVILIGVLMLPMSEVIATSPSIVETILQAPSGLPMRFGQSVSIYGNTAVVGAPHFSGDVWGFGAIFIFADMGGEWRQEAEFSHAWGQGYYGEQVSIYDDVAATGYTLDGDYNPGHSLLFVRNNDGIFNQQNMSGMGSIVALNGDTLVTAGHGHFNGVVGVYVRNNDVWSLQQIITDPEPSEVDYVDYFASGVAISGNTLVVSEFRFDSAGEIFIFSRINGVWTEQQKITANDLTPDDRFGSSLAIDRDTLVVGVRTKSNMTGAAYVYTRPGNTWVQQQKLTSKSTAVNDGFGNSVAIDGDVVVVGAPGNSDNTGSAYIFTRSGSTWSQQIMLNASDGAAGDQFGTVAIDGSTVVVGAPEADSGTGKAYIYVLPKPLSVATNEVTNVTIQSAQLNGSVTSMGTAPSVTTRFVWGTGQNTLTNTIDCQTLTSNGSFSGNITGLSPATTYYYQAQAVGQGTGQGTTKSFVTLSTPPSTTTDNASNVGHFGAQLNGNLSALGSATSVNVSYQWGTKPGNYSGETAVQSMGAAGSFYANLSGLSQNTTYYYRAKAAGHGTVYGSEKSFKTLAGGQMPTAATDNATNVGYNAARLNCTVTSMGTVQSAAVYFVWGTAPGVYFGTSQTVPVNGTSPVSLDAGGFSASTVYYYRAYVSFLFAPGDGGGFPANGEKTFTTSEAPPPPPPSYGGGGFGGGSGGGVPPGAGVTNLGIYTNSEGLFNIAGEAESEDGEVYIAIAKGVIAQTKDNTALKSLKIVAIDSPGAAPAGSQFIGLIYELTPDGATFTPGITLTIFFDPEAIPKGIDLNSLKIVVYNKETSKWEILPSTINKADSSISVTIGHFSVYAIVGSKVVPPTTSKLIPLPAKFATAELTVSPVSALPGQIVEVSTKVSNTGETAGEYEVVLKVNGTVEETRTVTVGARGTSVVTFTVIGSEPGSYDINVNGATGSFSIQQAPAATTIPTTVVAPTPIKGANWPVIGLILGGVGIAGLVATVLMVRRRKGEGTE